MPEHDFIQVFASRLNKLGIAYMVTGAVAATIYGEPRLTHDIDVVIDLRLQDIERFVDAFPFEEFYCPPPEVIRVETGRAQRGHFNLIHHETGLKADVYASGKDSLHKWGLANRRTVSVGGEDVCLAPPEYVILRKLEYYREGGSEKHMRDIAGMLELSRGEIDFVLLESKVHEMSLEQEWKEALEFKA
jgi:hypothetical protein